MDRSKHDDFLRSAYAILSEVKGVAGFDRPELHHLVTVWLDQYRDWRITACRDVIARTYADADPGEVTPGTKA